MTLPKLWVSQSFSSQLAPALVLLVSKIRRLSRPLMATMVRNVMLTLVNFLKATLMTFVDLRVVMVVDLPVGNSACLNPYPTPSYLRHPLPPLQTLIIEESSQLMQI
jgi:hypothetical protein